MDAAGMVLHMPAVSGRVARRYSEPMVTVAASVTPATKQRAQRIADALHIPVAAYLDQLLQRDEVDENFIPVWAERPLPVQDELGSEPDDDAEADRAA